MKNHRASLFAALFALILCNLMGLAPKAWAQAPSVSVSGARMTIKPPAGYTLRTRQTPGEKAKHSPGWFLDGVGPLADGRRAIFSISLAPAKPGVRYDASANARMRSELKEAFPDATGITAGTLRVGGEDAAWVAGLLPMSGRAMRTKGILFNHAGTRYTFTFTCAPSAFYRQVSAFDRAVASVRFQ